ncbi:10708_t:CDS:2, partial [Dentiscutata erythropus]
MSHEFLDLVKFLPVIPSIDLQGSRNKHTHYWIGHVKSVIAFFMNADDNMRHTLNSLRKDVGKKYKEAQDYEEWVSNLRQTYLSELFSRFQLKLMKELYSKYKKIMNIEILNTKVQNFLIQSWEQYKTEISQIVQRMDEESTIKERQIKIIKRTHGSVKTFNYVSKLRKSNRHHSSTIISFGISKPSLHHKRTNLAYASWPTINDSSNGTLKNNLKVSETDGDDESTERKVVVKDLKWRSKT